MSGGTPGSRQIHGIDLLRFLAATFVMFYHLAFCSYANVTSPGHPSAALFKPLSVFADLANTGWVGVQIFFVISGFVIAYTANGRSPASFASSRVVRLVPGVWICAALTVPALLYLGDEPALAAYKFLRTVSFTPTPPWVAGPYWTLFIEIAFYSVIFLTLCLNKFDFLEELISSIGVASMAFWLIALFANALHNEQIDNFVSYIQNHAFFQYILIRHGVFFALGALIWICKIKGMSPRRFALGIGFTTGGLIQIAYEADVTGAFMNASISGRVAGAIWLVVVGLIVLSVVCNDAISSVVRGRGVILRLLGLSSYPLYLLHDPLGIAGLRAMTLGGLSPVIGLFIAMAAMIALSLFVSALVEPDLQALLRRMLKRDQLVLPPWLSFLRKDTASFLPAPDQMPFR